MNIYQSEFLSITKENHTLIQSWTDVKLSVTDYQQELNNFIDLFYKVKPQRIVCDAAKCTLEIPPALHSWMGEKILLPMYKKGIREIGMTISQDVAVQFSIVDSLQKAIEIIRPVYFSDLNEAMHLPWGQPAVFLTSPEIKCHLNADSNSFDIHLNIPPNDLPIFLKVLSQVKDDRQFLEDNLHRYNSLTHREIQVFKLIFQGRTNFQIGQELFIEESSVKSHRKKIKEKLQIKSMYDIYRYAKSIHLI